MKLLKPSMTLQISAKAKNMVQEGIPVMDFSVGEPDFPTLTVAKNAGKKAIDENFSRYTQADGIPALKEAVLAQLKDEDGLQYTTSEIIICSGAKSAIYFLLAAVLNEGDEVLIPAPYWVSYPEQVRLAGGIPIIVECLEEDNFLLNPRRLQSQITMNSKVLILNNPSNPTGAVYSDEALKQILDIADRYNLIVIADEVYSKIMYDDMTFLRAARCHPELRSRIVTIDGASKAYSMTGWRIGFAAGDAELIGAMKRIQSHVNSNPCSISQKAAEAAYVADQSEVRERERIFQERRDFIYQQLTSVPGISCFKPRGAFYLFPNISYYFGMSDGKYLIRNAMDLVNYLLDKAHVATVPGDAFGASDFIRLSFAASMEDLKKGTGQLIAALGELGKP